MRCWIIVLGIAVTLVLVAGPPAGAIPTNPNPAVWGPDSGGTVFGHGDVVLVNEVLVPIRDNPPNVPVFLGFYFDGTGAIGTGSDGLPNAGIIFDNGDPVGNTALIQFQMGKVYDTDNNPATVQSSFTTAPAGSGNIGFFISVQFPNTTGFTTLFTDPALNPGGIDLAAAFPALADPTIYMIAFDVPAGSNTFTLAYRAQFRGISAVPEPATVLLLATGLAALGAYRKRIGRRHG